MTDPYGPPASSPTWEASLGTVRHVLTALGGGLVAFSLASPAEVAQAVDAVMAIAGAVSFLAGLAWSIRDKWSRR